MSGLASRSEQAQASGCRSELGPELEPDLAPDSGLALESASASDLVQESDLAFEPAQASVPPV